MVLRGSFSEGDLCCCEVCGALSHMVVFPVVHAGSRMAIYPKHTRKGGGSRTEMGFLIKQSLERSLSPVLCVLGLTCVLGELEPCCLINPIIVIRLPLWLKSSEAIRARN